MLIPGSCTNVEGVAHVSPSLISNILITGVGQALMGGAKWALNGKTFSFGDAANIFYTDIIPVSVLFILIFIEMACSLVCIKNETQSNVMSP